MRASQGCPVLHPASSSWDLAGFSRKMYLSKGKMQSKQLGVRKKVKNKSVSTKIRKKKLREGVSPGSRTGCSAAHRDGVVEQIFTLQPVVDPVLEISCDGYFLQGLRPMESPCWSWLVLKDCSPS